MKGKTLNTKINGIQRIEKSELFKKQSILIKILYYLVEAEEKGETPKSTTIALEVLGDERSESVPLDAYIRTQIHTLRKKLEMYYFTEGKEESVRLSIPKGKYKIVLEEVHNTKKTDVSKNKKYVFVFVGIIVVSLSLNLYFFYHSNTISEHSKTNNKLELFEPLFSDQKQLVVVTGAKLFYKEYDVQQARYRFIYDYDTSFNYSARMKRLRGKFPERKIKNTEVTFTEHGDFDFVEAFKFYYHNKNIKKGFATSTEYKASNSNILFIGNLSPDNMGKLSSYFQKSSFEAVVSDYEKGVVSLLLNKQVYRRMIINEKSKKTYFLIFKTKAVENELLFLVGLTNFAKKYMFNEMYTPSFSEEIKQHFGNSLPHEYEVLFEIEHQPIGTRHKIIYAKNFDQ